MGTVKVKSGSNEGKVQYPYDAMVYIDGTVVCAVDKEGNTIKRGVAGTDDATVIQAAVNSISSGKVMIKDGSYVISSQITVDHGIILYLGSSEFDLASINTDAFAFNSGGGFVDDKITGIIGGVFEGNAANTSTYVCSFNRIGNGVIFENTILNNSNAIRLIGECYLSKVSNVHCTNITGSCIQTELGATATWGSNGSIFDHVYIEGGFAGSIGFNFLAGENHIRDSYLEALPQYVVINLLDSSGGPWIDIFGCKFGLRNVNCTAITYTKSGGADHSCSVKNCHFRVSDHINTLFKLDGSYVYVMEISENEFSIGSDTTIINPTSTGRVTFNNNFVYIASNTYPLFIFNGNYNEIKNNSVLWEYSGAGSIVKITAVTSEENDISGNNFVSSTNYVNFTDPTSTGVLTNTNIVNNKLLRITNFTGLGSLSRIFGNTIRGTVAVTFSSAGDFSNNVFPELNKLTLIEANSRIRDNINYVHISEIRDIINSVLEIFGDSRLVSTFSQTNGTAITDYTRGSKTLTAQASVSTWVGIKNKATYYDFDGSAKYLYRANDTDFDFGNSVNDSAFSVVVAINPDSSTSRFLIGKWDANNAREWRLFLDASGYPTLQLYDESVDKYIGRQDQTAFTTGSWKILVATYDGSGICAGCKVYIDGVQLDDADYTDAGYVAMEAVTANLMVGALKNAAAYSEYYDGKMTWIGVAAKELSADEVWSLTQRLKGVLGI